ncbi:twin-arginine translocase TatA/TatE family subunit [Olsenella sp. YH-ols2223]|uniref:Sec-independent protein translocase protein TatA n=2 Tax=Olsenella absiana TaxID=3115222 RepID=A0ABU7RBY2_9ACTN
MFLGMGAPELIVILLVALVLFGPKNLPKLGTALGQTVKSVREGMEGADEPSGRKEAETSEAAASQDATSDADAASPAAGADTAASADDSAAGAEPARTRACPECGAMNEQEAAFCSRCGARLA